MISKPCRCWLDLVKPFLTERKKRWKWAHHHLWLGVWRCNQVIYTYTHTLRSAFPTQKSIRRQVRLFAFEFHVCWFISSKRFEWYGVARKWANKVKNFQWSLTDCIANANCVLVCRYPFYIRRVWNWRNENASETQFTMTTRLSLLFLCMRLLLLRCINI